MADIRYTIKVGQKPTEEQIREIEEAKNYSITFDEDCPEVSEENGPEMYAAMMKAVVERNRRLEIMKKALA